MLTKCINYIITIKIYKISKQIVYNSINKKPLLFIISNNKVLYNYNIINCTKQNLCTLVYQLEEE